MPPTSTSSSAWSLPANTHNVRQMANNNSASHAFKMKLNETNTRNDLYNVALKNCSDLIQATATILGSKINFFLSKSQCIIIIFLGVTNITSQSTFINCCDRFLPQFHMVQLFLDFLFSLGNSHPKVFSG